MSKLFRQLKRSINQIAQTERYKRTGKRDWLYELSELKDAALATLFYSWFDNIIVFVEFLERCWAWLPILWKDRNWDHSFILDVLEFKIKQTRLCIAKYNRHTTVKEDCKNMRIAEILINRIRNDDYGDMFMEAHDAKWGKLDWSFKDRNDDNILMAGKFSKSGLTRPGIQSQKDWELENKEHLVIIKHCSYLKSQDYDYLFKHLKKHLERWWD